MKLLLIFNSFLTVKYCGPPNRHLKSRIKRWENWQLWNLVSLSLLVKFFKKESSRFFNYSYFRKNNNVKTTDFTEQSAFLSENKVKTVRYYLAYTRNYLLGNRKPCIFRTLIRTRRFHATENWAVVVFLKCFWILTNLSFSIPINCILLKNWLIKQLLFDSF